MRHLAFRLFLTVLSRLSDHERAQVRRALNAKTPPAAATAKGADPQSLDDLFIQKINALDARLRVVEGLEDVLPRPGTHFL